MCVCTLLSPHAQRCAGSTGSMRTQCVSLQRSSQSGPMMLRSWRAPARAMCSLGTGSGRDAISREGAEGGALIFPRSFGATNRLVARRRENSRYARCFLETRRRARRFSSPNVAPLNVVARCVWADDIVKNFGQSCLWHALYFSPCLVAGTASAA